jgi:hypothetical protein
MFSFDELEFLPIERSRCQEIYVPQILLQADIQVIQHPAYLDHNPRLRAKKLHIGNQLEFF